MGEFIGNKEQKGAEVVKPAVEAPVKIEELSLEDGIFDDSIIAKPLGFDNSLDIEKRIKNRNNYYRWVNRYAQDMRRYQECLAMGYSNATPQDVDVDPVMVKDGAVIVGDLILMKMDKAKAFGAMKANFIKGNEMVAAKRDPKKLKESIAKELGKAGAAEALAEKVQFFRT